MNLFSGGEKTSNIRKYAALVDGELQLQLGIKSLDDISSKFLVSTDSNSFMISSDFCSELNEILGSIPRRVSLCLNLRVSDMGGRGEDEIEEMMQDSLKFRSGGMRIKSMRLLTNSLSLIFMGALFLLLSYFLSDGVPRVVSDIINIGGTLMIWEAVSRFIFERKQYNDMLYKYSKIRVKVISVCTENVV